MLPLLAPLVPFLAAVGAPVVGAEPVAAFCAVGLADCVCVGGLLGAGLLGAGLLGAGLEPGSPSLEPVPGAGRPAAAEVGAVAPPVSSSKNAFMYSVLHACL